MSVPQERGAEVAAGERLGATYLGDGRTAFLVWAPGSERVDVVLGGRSGETRLESRELGYHGGVVAGVESGARYRYRLDGGPELPDPASRSQPDVHGPSLVVDPSRFEWSDQDWAGLPLRRYVLYELHVGTFTPEGTFDAAIEHLEELRELGVTAVELMPVAQFPGHRNWGYDGVYPFAVQDSYGGPDGLKRFVDACHGHGLGACLDVVHNHIGPEGNHLREFGPYFTDRYRTPWGDAINVDGAWSDEVRRFFIDSAVERFEDYHVDALRLDAIDWILDVTASPFLRELADRVHGLDLGRPLHLIAETDLGDPRVVKAADAGGLGQDGQWADDFHHATHALLTGERGGYYQDFGRPEDLTVAYRDGYVYQGRYSTFRQRRHGAPTGDLPAERFVVFAQNHDQVGNHPLALRLSQLVDFESLKLAAGCFLLSPFVPLLFMGEEYGELAPFHYFVDHSDPKLIQSVRRGRRAELASFGWEGTGPDPQDEATFERSKLDHSLKDKDQHRQLRELYRELLRLRREVPPLAEMDRDACMPLPVRGELLSILRAQGEDRVMIRLSFAHEAVSEPAPPGRWRTLLDSADAAWSGPGSEMPAVIDGASSPPITQRPRSVVVLRSLPEGAGA